jgi:hypothetical protein
MDGAAFSTSATPIVDGYHFQTIDYPGSLETDVAQSNDAGYAVGWYLDQNRVSHGFLYHQGHFTNYDFPGSLNTALLGINAKNQAVGRHTNAQGYVQGFELQNGIGTNIFVQVQNAGQSYTLSTNEVDGIDDEDNMVGVFYDWAVSNENHGFLLSGNRQATVDYPDATYTSASGVTGSVVAGWFVDIASHAHGFFWHDGEFASFDFPGAGVAPDGSTGYTLGSKINPGLSVAGYWGTATSYNHGFLIDGENQKMISFDFPEAVSTTNYGISNGGTIAGSYLLNNVTHGFLAAAGSIATSRRGAVPALAALDVATASFDLTRHRFGINYTPSRNWWYCWNDWDADPIKSDLDAIAALGADHLRIFIIWPYFQPNPQRVSPVHLDRLDQMIRLMGERGLDALVTVFTGGLTGVGFLLSFLHPRGSAPMTAYSTIQRKWSPAHSLRRHCNSGGAHRSSWCENWPGL